MDGFRLFGVHIDTPTLAGAVEEIVGAARKRDGVTRHFAFVNADCMNTAWRGWRYKRVLDAAHRVYPDGTGLRIAARSLGYEAPENVNGTDLFPLLCAESAAEDGPSLYLLGGAPGVAERCADRMCARFPGLRIVGARDGFFSEITEEETLAEIARLKPDVLLVGMGSERQESWIHAHGHRLGAAVAIGVGGLFDFYSGDIPRAPLAMRRAGIEWIWRLAMQPRRLFRRYILGNPRFLSRVFREKRARRESGSVRAIRRRYWRAERGRREIDMIAAGAGLLLLMPLMLAAALAVKLESRGPALFVQTRIGRDGRTFRLYKLRTMFADAEKRRAALAARNEMAGGVLFKMQGDPRITRTGQVLRKYSIDELPQLWNVLRGDMALVGPRPALPEEVEQYGVVACERLRVKPGLTGLWQISGRSTLPFAEQVRLDIENAARRSEIYDAKLILRTAPAVIRGSGAW